ncbi:MAG: guanylate kinase [Blastocatellia bacterium]
MIGNLIIVSAPSGAGKTTLVSEVLNRDARIKPSVSFTSRSPRNGEENGAHYNFVSAEEFRAMIERGDFLEWAEVHGNFYGTSRRLVEQLRGEGHDVILTIDVQGAEQARQLFPDAVSVFILPPSYQTLLDRLDTRGANGKDDLQLRLRNAIDELAQYQNFDYAIINDDLQHATNELAAIILAERCRIKQRGERVEQIIKTFE